MENWLDTQGDIIANFKWVGHFDLPSDIYVSKKLKIKTKREEWLIIEDFRTQPTLSENLTFLSVNCLISCVHVLRNAIRI